MTLTQSILISIPIAVIFFLGISIGVSIALVFGKKDKKIN
jgi:hypothetical protein